MKIIRNAIAVGLLAAATVVACSSQHGLTTGTSSNTNPGSTQVPTDSTGAIGMSLEVPPGVNVYALSWTISNTTNTYSGTVNLGDAAIFGSVEFVAGGIAAGSNYVLTINGADANGDPCTGASAPFTVAAGSNTTVGLPIVCTVPTDAATPATVTTGGVQVDAGITLVGQAAYSCPGISALSISPALAAVGSSVSLTAVQFGGAAPAAPGVWTWSVSPATGGAFTPPTEPGVTASATFQCQSAGTFTITASLDSNLVPLGSDASVDECHEVISAQVNCAAAGGFQCFGAGQSACPPTNPTYCATLQTDVANCGTCGNVCPVGDTCAAGACKAPAPTACTTAPCAASGPNSVKCTGSAGGVCSSTELPFINKDIAAGLLTAGGQASAASCYHCLTVFNCVDNASTSGEECSDVPSTFAPTGTSAGETPANACLDVINCTLTNKCATSNPDSVCYCGTAVGSACNTAANGACLSQEANGSGFPTSDGTDVNLDYTDTGRSAGMANTIFACAFSNSCANCLN